ncbi:programmed cell death protein 5-like [Artemia franciscana]
MEEETNKQKALEERKARELETKHSILSQVLDQEARARLNTISVAKPEKASQIENMLIQMAQTGRIRGRLNDKELLGLLEQVGAMQQSKPSVTVKFDRRRAMLDDSDDDY